MLDRKLAPPFVKSTSFQLPAPHRISLPGGNDIYHISEVQQAVVKLELVYEAGRWYEPQPGISYFTAHMLEKGTTSKTAFDLASFFDRYGAHIEIHSNPDFVSIGLYSLTKHLNQVLPVFFEMVSAPSFDTEELRQLKENYIQGLRIKNEKTSHLASKHIRRQVFGETHPYGKSEEEKDIKKIERSDLLSFFEFLKVPYKVFLLGKVDDAVLHALEKNFVLGQPKMNGIFGFQLFNQKPTAEIIDKENSVQSSIRLGKLTVPRLHPDYAKLLILVYHLGGYFGSRLMKNLREEKGLTYGISSSVAAFKNGSAILIGTDVNKENRGLAVDEIKKEIRRLRTEPIGPEELELSKRHYIGGIQSEIASPFSVLEKIKNIELNNLPSDYYQHIIQEVDAATPNILRDLANKYLDEESFCTVTVG